MENSNHEGHFYKGLFFGLLIGVGAVLFSQTDKGKKIVRQAKEKIDEALATPMMENFDEEEEIGVASEPVKRKSKSPKKFFKTKK